MITENISTLKIHKLSQEQYNNAVESGNVEGNALYLTPAEDDIEKHNSSTTAHEDIRKAVSDNTKRVNNLEEDLNIDKQKIEESKSQFDIKSVEGVNPVINNGANTSFYGMKLYGKTTQPTTTGKQLFDIDTVKTNYINPGTGVEEANDSWKNTPSISCKANATYTFSMKTKEFFQFAVSFYDSNKNFISGDSKSAYNITQYTFTTPSNTSFMRVGYSFKLSSGEVVRDEIMLNEGTEALPWEKYSGLQPSPSPNYPQLLESKGKWGNLFDKATRNIGKRVDNNGNFDTSDDLDCSDYIEVKPNTNYYLTNVCGAYYYYTGCIYDKDKKFLRQIILNENNLTILSGVINTGNDAKYLIINTKNNMVDSCMVHEGTTALPYRPYTGQREIESGVYGGNLLPLEDTEITYNGLNVKVKDGIVTLNGTTTDYSWIVLGEKYLHKGTYTSRCENQQLGDFVFYIFNIEEKEIALRKDVAYIQEIEANTYQFILGIESGKTLNVSFKPKLNYGTEELPWTPYTKQSHISLVGNGLKGIPVTDASLATYTDENGQMICSDVKDNEKGMNNSKVYEEVLDGTESTTMLTTQGINLFSVKTKKKILQLKSGRGSFGFCSHYAVNTSSDVKYDNPYVWFTPLIITDDTQKVLIRDDRFASVEELKAWLAEQYANGTPVTVQYILAEPIETPLSADEIASYKALHTNNPNTTIMNDCDAFMKIGYLDQKYEDGMLDVVEKIVESKLEAFFTKYMNELNS